jgi:hypothetical protein
MQTAAKSDSGAAVRYIPRIGGKRGDLELNVIQDELGEKTVTREHQRRSELWYQKPGSLTGPPMDTPSSTSVCTLKQLTTTIEHQCSLMEKSPDFGRSATLSKWRSRRKSSASGRSANASLTGQLRSVSKGK